MRIDDTLAKILLVACDQAYDRSVEPWTPNGYPGTYLAPDLETDERGRQRRARRYSDERYKERPLEWRSV